MYEPRTHMQTRKSILDQEVSCFQKQRLLRILHPRTYLNHSWFEYCLFLKGNFVRQVWYPYEPNTVRLRPDGKKPICWMTTQSLRSRFYTLQSAHHTHIHAITSSPVFVMVSSHFVHHWRSFFSSIVSFSPTNGFTVCLSLTLSLSLAHKRCALALSHTLRLSYCLFLNVTTHTIWNIPFLVRCVYSHCIRARWRVPCVRDSALWKL